MDNNQDQLQKNVYQVPVPSGAEVFDNSTPIQETDVVSLAESSVIAREEVLDAFNQRTQDLEMAVSGFEVRKQPKVEIVQPHPVAVELLQIGDELARRRAEHHEVVRNTPFFKRIIGL